MASLYTNGLRVTLSADDFAQYDLIAISSADSTGAVALELASAGSLSIAAALGDRAAHVLGSSGDDAITTGLGDDSLFGGLGNDTLTGGPGADRLFGGDGDDSFVWRDASNGTDLFQGGAGFDSLILASPGIAVHRLILVTAASVEAVDFQNRVLHGTALADQIDLSGVQSFVNDFADQDGFGVVIDLGAGADRFVGDVTDGYIIGGAGNDTLTGGGSGNFFMPGGGTDVVICLDGNDIIQLLTSKTTRDSYFGGDGVDILSITNAVNLRFLTLDAAASIEVLSVGFPDSTLSGTALDDVFDLSGVTTVQMFDTLNMGAGNDLTKGSQDEDKIDGGAGHDTLSGGAQNDLLYGGEGNDKLDGGTGEDYLYGGGGDNIFVINALGDHIDNSAGLAGTGTVQTSLTRFSLQGVMHVTSLIATGTRGAWLTGNDDANVITGTLGNDTLEGLGGVDTLKGGGGDDIYRVDAGSEVIEQAGGGIDTMESDSASIRLARNVENLTLLGPAGSLGVGNDVDNIIRGGMGRDTIVGGGGNDTMAGGRDNDVYRVDDAGDVVIERAGQGLDGVGTALAHYVLPQNLEFLGGFNADGQDLSGNAARNLIQTSDGNDTIRGGSGSDTMLGGLGQDVFIFDTALTSIDHIKDFDAADTMALTARLSGPFAGLAHGQLRAAAFKVIGPDGQTVDATDRILYDSSNGKLYFDADGSGAAVRVQFAVLTNHAGLTASDFLVL